MKEMGACCITLGLVALLYAAAIACALTATTGCVIGRLDSDHLRIIPITEVHRMDDKGFPLNLFQHEQNCQP